MVLQLGPGHPIEEREGHQRQVLGKPAGEHLEAGEQEHSAESSPATGSEVVADVL